MRTQTTISDALAEAAEWLRIAQGRMKSLNPGSPDRLWVGSLREYKKLCQLAAKVMAFEREIRRLESKRTRNNVDEHIKKQ